MEEWMKHILLLVLMLSFLYFPVGPGYADETENKETASVDKVETIESGTETEAEQSKIYMKIGEITVTEKAYLPTADIPASVDVVGKDQIEMENVDTSNELMKKIPVSISETGTRASSQHLHPERLRREHSPSRGPYHRRCSFLLQQLERH